MERTKKYMYLMMFAVVSLIVLFSINEINNKKEISFYENKIIELNKTINEYSNMDIIEYTPESSEVEKIVNELNLSNKEFIEEDFNCVEFSHSLIKELRKNNIYSCITEIYFYGGNAHANVAVNTSDKGLIYIEPQENLLIYDLKIGDDYCDKVNWYCDWNISHLKTCY